MIIEDYKYRKTVNLILEAIDRDIIKIDDEKKAILEPLITQKEEKWREYCIKNREIMKIENEHHKILLTLYYELMNIPDLVSIVSRLFPAHAFIETGEIPEIFID